MHRHPHPPADQSLPAPTLLRRTLLWQCLIAGLWAPAVLAQDAPQETDAKTLQAVEVKGEAASYV
ncbi:MAG TPA: hypothetical protein VFH12_07980, partial [Pseudoxanthomonas sp.]|nr:hypothetical protein [Pseudoxanthomonas sp.]